MHCSYNTYMVRNSKGLKISEKDQCIKYYLYKSLESFYYILINCRIIINNGTEFHIKARPT